MKDKSLIGCKVSLKKNAPAPLFVPDRGVIIAERKALVSATEKVITILWEDGVALDYFSDGPFMSSYEMVKSDLASFI